MILSWFIFLTVVQGISCGKCFQCDSTNYASCSTVTCPTNMCQTRTALNGMVSHMCWSGHLGVTSGCKVEFGEQVCICSGDMCNDAGITSNNNSNASGGNFGTAGWGNNIGMNGNNGNSAGWGNNNGMNGNNGNSAGWGNWGSGNNGKNEGNWKDWGNNQAQNWGRQNGNSASNNGNCNGNGNNTDCNGNGHYRLKADYKILFAVSVFITAVELYKH